MSMCYWGIVGYGMENMEEKVDEAKMEALLASKGIDGYDLNDYASNVFESNMFQIVDNGDGGCYYLYSPSAPWRLTETEKAFTCLEDVQKELYQSIKEVLRDDITEEDFGAQCDWISTYGAS